MTSGKIRNSHGQRGDAVIFALVAVALLAGLSYAVTQSTKGGPSQAEIRLAAGQLVQEASSVRTAVSQMIIRGTPAADISFTSFVGKKDAFDFAHGGGDGTNALPPQEACVNADDCNAGWLYPGETDQTHGLFVAGVGTAAPELLAVLQGKSGVTLAVCEQIQKGLGFASSVPPVDTVPVNWKDTTGTIQAWPVTASSATTVYDDGDKIPVLPGRQFACIQNGTTGVYAYYHTLAAQ